MASNPHAHDRMQPTGRAASPGEPRSSTPGFWTSRSGLATIGFLLIAGFFLLFPEHRLHALGFLPYLLILACPLMHFFMHGGHGHAGHGASRAGSPDRRPEEPGART